VIEREIEKERKGWFMSLNLILMLNYGATVATSHDVTTVGTFDETCFVDKYQVNDCNQTRWKLSLVFSAPCLAKAQ